MRKTIVMTLILLCAGLCCACGTAGSTAVPATETEYTAFTPLTETAEDTEGTDAGTETIEDTEDTPEIVETEWEPDTPYGTSDHYLKIVGLKEYTKLKSDLYTDAPASGKIFLVMFVQYESYTEDSEYFNPLYLTASVDGVGTETTTLVNDPEDVATIFSNLSGNGTTYGYIAWEVPEDWSTMDIQYSGLEYTDAVVLQTSITPDDLFDPVIEE